MKQLKKLIVYSVIAALLLSFGAFAWAESSAAEDQIVLIANHSDMFLQSGGQTEWYYAVTDLDHNGILEVIAACADSATEENAKIWEVNSTQDGFTKCGTLFSSGESFPNILTENADTYHGVANDLWSYVFTDSDGAEDSFSNKICSLSLISGNFVYTLHASESSEIINGYVAVTFENSNGDIVTPDEYKNAAKEFFDGCERSSTSFGWFKGSSISEAAAADSFAVFSGEKAPEDVSVIRENDPAALSADVGAKTEIPEVSPEVPEESAAAPTEATAEKTEEVKEYTPEGFEIVQYNGPEQPEIVQYNGPETVQYAEAPAEIIYYDQPVQPQIVYPTPAPTPAFVPLSITRNPTNEFRHVGDTARFVACATTVQNLSWAFVDPSGNTVSQQYFCSLFPFSSVDGSSTTLYISNVTAEMNGWGAYCSFSTADGQFASTNTAYIIMS